MSYTNCIVQGYGFLTLVEGGKSSTSTASKQPLFLPVQIQDLIQKLQELENVEEVRYIFQTPGDIHSLIFQIKITEMHEDEEIDEDEYELNSPQTEKITHPLETLYEQAQKLVLTTCKQLRDTTREKWYLDAQLVTDFDQQLWDF